MPGLGTVDAWAREQATRRGQEARARQLRSAIIDLSGREPGSAARRVGDLLGQSSDSQIAAFTSQLQGANREELIRRAAEAQRPGLIQQVNQILAGTDQRSRLGQAGIYGAIGGGGVMGGVALTEAGQQLLALMSHMQQGQQTEAQRDQAPIA